MANDEATTFMSQTSDEMAKRVALTREILRTDKGVEEAAKLAPAQRTGAGPRGLPLIDWAGAGVAALAPKARDPVPGWLDGMPLPKADVVVMTWTSAEWDALHYVFSNTLSPLPNSASNNQWRAKWQPYRRDFYKVYQGLWMRRLVSAAQNRGAGAPALVDNQWGSFARVTVGTKSVLLFKSDLHINQDGESLPLLDLVRQILEDCEPAMLLSIGTSGGVRMTDVLGDVVVTNAAKFRLGDEFNSASFNRTTHTCNAWTPSNQYLAAANSLLTVVPEFDAFPPTAHFPAGAVIHPAPPRGPQVHLVPGVPILTTDFFEYGTTTNGLGNEGCCVEMDDAVIAMAVEKYRSATQYGFVRNVSDPVINGNLPRQLQTAWAVVSYQMKGLYTSYNGAIATWAMIAGL